VIWMPWHVLLIGMLLYDASCTCLRLIVRTESLKEHSVLSTSTISNFSKEGLVCSLDAARRLIYKSVRNRSQNIH